jgi:hypothetical protein
MSCRLPDEQYFEEGPEKGSPKHIASMGLAEVNIGKHGTARPARSRRFNSAYTSSAT